MAAPLPPSLLDQKISSTCSGDLVAPLPVSLSVARCLAPDSCDRDLLVVDPGVSVSPSPSTASTSTSSLFFGPASSVNSLNSSYTSETESKSASDLDSLASAGGSQPVVGLVRSGFTVAVPVLPTARSSLRQPRMGQSNQNKSPRPSDPLARTRLKESNQSPTDGFPCRVRLLDGEEHCLPATLRNSYTAFALSGAEGMNGAVNAPPNRTVDYSVCENMDESHRCAAGHCRLPASCPPPYGSHLGDGFCNSKKDSASTRTGKFKEVMKTMFDRVVRPGGNCRSENEKSSTTKTKSRSSSCSNETMVAPRSPFHSTNNSSSSAPMAMTGPRRPSPPARLPSSASARTTGGDHWPAQFSGAPPTYDAVMKEAKTKRK